MIFMMFFVCWYRKANNNIVVSYVFDEVESGIPNPVQTFEQCFAHYPEILEEIYKQNFEVPSPIQCQAWPVLLKGHDLTGIAQTGTGKMLIKVLYCCLMNCFRLYVICFV